MLITVAIPTIQGREKYLASSLKTCTTQDVDNVEILVSDNSPGSAEEVVRSANDMRVRYIKTPSFLPMSAHWDFVLQHARGESISIIGDDDGLMPNGLSIVNEIHDDVGNVPIHHSSCNYHWPDYIVSEDQNTVDLWDGTSGDASWVQTADFLRALAAGRARYLNGPMIYHNFIPTQIIRTISNNGVFFRRAIPDVYSAVAIAANIDRFYSVPQFLTMFGQGAKANGAQVKAGSLEGSKFFEQSSTISTYNPRFSSRTVSLLLLDSILEVAETFDLDDLRMSIDLPMFLANGLLEARHMRGQRLREFSEIARLAIRRGIGVSTLSNIVERVVRRLPSRLRTSENNVVNRGLPSRIKMPAGVNNVFDASITLDRMLDRGPVTA